MSNRIIKIVAGLVIALMLAAGVWSNMYGNGQWRSVRFGQELEIASDYPYPVAVLVSVTNPDGTTTPIAWGGLGGKGGTKAFPDVRVPTGNTLLIEYSSGMNVVPFVGDPPDIVEVYKAITGGPAIAKATMIPVDGLKDDFKGSTTITCTAGTRTTVGIYSRGVTIKTSPGSGR